MKKLLVLSAILIGLSSCTSKTEFGPCIGAFEDKNPAKVYKISIWNVAMGIIFIEMLIPPIVVIVDGTLCPVGNK